MRHDVTSLCCCQGVFRPLLPAACALPPLPGMLAPPGLPTCRACPLACSAGADPGCKDFDGKTPLHEALEMQASCCLPAALAIRIPTAA